MEQTLRNQSYPNKIPHDVTKNRHTTRTPNTRILLLDGGFGTMINNTAWTESRLPGQKVRRGRKKLLQRLQRPAEPHPVRKQSAKSTKYLQAGSDVITSNTFNANSISLADYGLAAEAYPLTGSAQPSPAAADAFTARNPPKPRFVGGSMGPTSHTLSMSADVDNPAPGAPRTALAGVLRSGSGPDGRRRRSADARSRLRCAERQGGDLRHRIPLRPNAACDCRSSSPARSPRQDAPWRDKPSRPSTPPSHTPTAGREPQRCSFGAKALLPHLEQLAAVSEFRVAVYPNAGLPNVMGGYDETPAMFAADVEEYMRRGLVNLVGGCCGTTPLHIFQLAKIVNNYAPRPPAAAAARDLPERAGTASDRTRSQLRQCRRAHQRRRLG